MYSTRHCNSSYKTSARAIERVNNYCIKIHNKENQINTYILKRIQANEMIKLFDGYNNDYAKKYIHQFQYFNGKINILRDEVANLKMEYNNYLNE